MADTPTREELADRICRDVADLPDRTSPDDQPEMMLVTGDELHGIVMNALEAVTLPPVAAGGGWRPIETAPKDGETFLNLWCPRDRSIWHAKWQGEGWYGVDEYGLTRDSFATTDEITHWQPLPSPPHPRYGEVNARDTQILAWAKSPTQCGRHQGQHLPQEQAAADRRCAEG